MRSVISAGVYYDYDHGVTHESPLLRDAAAVLESLRLVEARTSSAETGREQLDVLLARVAGLTALLRGAGNTRDAEAERLVTRLALNDLAMIAAHLRSTSDEIGKRLEHSAAAAAESYDQVSALSES